MPTYIHLVRHAQGFHNLSAANQQLPDPELTPLGKEQCASLCKAFPSHGKITHLVASPMRRTLYTCLLSFEPAAKAGKAVIALPEVQEVSNLPCDVGSAPGVLRGEFDAAAVDLGRVTEGWNAKGPGSPWAPVMERLEARARTARVWLRELGAGVEDAHIVVVTHGGFLHFMTQDWDGMNADKGTGWSNTEYRTYEFADGTGADPEASLKETGGSWKWRRGSAIELTETEQMEMRAAAKGYLEKEFAKLGGSK
ncbi:histidine phosphatase superfamily [Lasiosphaeria hispida]|uniref:Histidine phosphatase superfamily n=1 Tax=Lasiosphaeria hispida TaxID=260671 RepID=A0AAJ0HEG6_9PEZI|nr:histidine phosphatase superfamily [Lasiosphaeria hispida]